MSRAKIITDGDLEVSFLLACFVVRPRQTVALRCTMNRSQRFGDPFSNAKLS